MAMSQQLFKEEFLPEETGKLWNFLRHHPALQGFVLIGGTALALQIGHRLSEDLDFAYNAVRLPHMRVDARGYGPHDVTPSDYQSLRPDVTFCGCSESARRMHDW